MTRRPLAAFSALAVLGLALSACAPAVDPSWRPPTWPVADLTLDAALPATAPSEAVPGLVAQRIRNDRIGVQARFSYLPGTGAQVDPFNDAVDAFVRSAIDGRVSATGVAYAPQVHPVGAGLGDRGCDAGSTEVAAAELLADPAAGPTGGAGTAVVCEVVLATGPFFAQRLRAVTGSADGIQSDSSTTLYADTQTGEVVQAAGLWTDAAAGALAGNVIEADRRAAGSLSLAPAVPTGGEEATAVQAALASTVPTPDGGLAFTLPAGFTGPTLAAAGIPATTEPVTVTVDAALAATLVSPFGARLLAAAGAPYAGPADAPAGRDRVDCDLVPCVGLTYDDGPSDLTAGILDQLAAHSASATFFVMGQKVRGYADVVKRAVDEGHLVENHSWSHPQLPTLSEAAVAKQIRDTNAAIQSATGIPAIAFRPPYGEYNQSVLRAAGMPAILWDVDTLDWRGPADDVLLRRIVDQPSPGSIVLQHDVHANTANTAGEAYEQLQDRGFTIVNLVQLFDGAFPTSGAWRSAR